MVDMSGIGKNHQVTPASKLPAGELEQIGSEVAEMRHKIEPSASQHQRKSTPLTGRTTNKNVGPELNTVAAHHFPNWGKAK